MFSHVRYKGIGGWEGEVGIKWVIELKLPVHPSSKAKHKRWMDAEIH